MKPENVLVDRDGYIKITDFGLSKENITSGNMAQSLCGTAEYLSPEIISRTGHGKASDWWSFGALICEMLIGSPPFYSQDRERLYRNIKNSEPKLNYSFLSPNAKDIITKLLTKNPDHRLGSGENGVEHIKAHPWF